MSLVFINSYFKQKIKVIKKNEKIKGKMVGSNFYFLIAALHDQSNCTVYFCRLEKAAQLLQIRKQILGEISV